MLFSLFSQNIVLIIRMMNSLPCTSIYIPRMKKYHTCDEISQCMKYHRIGIVSSVDFMPIKKEPGFLQSMTDDDEWMSVFIHFAQIPAQYCSFAINQEFWKTIHEKNPNKLQISPTEYWICVQNEAPVKRTFMNIHQVVDNCAYLQTIIEVQDAKMKAMEDNMSRLQQVVAQLLAKETETDKQSLMDVLFGK